MKCKLCNREAKENGYCPLHCRAYQIVVERYNDWQRASNVSWTQYLNQIQKNSLTGEWAKDVAKQLISEEGTDVRKNKEKH